MKPCSPASFTADTEADARRALGQHEVIKDVSVTEKEGWWVIGRRTSEGMVDSAFWAQVSVLTGGVVLVHGDVGPVLFGYYSGGTREDAVRWLAKAGPDYVAEKASIGMRRPVTKREPEAMLWELDERIRSIQSVGSFGELSEHEQHLIAIYEEGRCMLQTGSDPALVDEFIYSRTGDCEDIVRGEVVDSQVVFCHGVIKKLWELLEAQGDKK